MAQSRPPRCTRRNHGDVRRGRGGGAAGGAGRGDREPRQRSRRPPPGGCAGAVGALAIATLVAVLAGGLAVAAATRSARVRHGWDTFKARLRRQQHPGSRLDERAGEQPLRLLPRGARRIRGPSARWGSARTTSSSSTSCTGAATRPRATRTASSCARSSQTRPGRARCWRSSAWGRRCWRRSRGPARVGTARRSAGPRRWRRRRWRDSPTGSVHGSFDWFWEFAGLGAPAFALLGLACALAPRHRAATSSAHRRDAGARRPRRSAGRPRRLQAPRGRSPRGGRAGADSAPRLRLAGSFVAAVRSVRWRRRGSASCRCRAPRGSGRRRRCGVRALERRGRLNPLSDEPIWWRASIALRFGDLRAPTTSSRWRSDATPDDAYATLERGAIASAEGDRERRSAARAGRAAEPADPLTRQALLSCGQANA